VFRTRPRLRLLGLAPFLVAATAAAGAAGCSALIKPPAPSSGSGEAGGRKATRASSGGGKRPSGKSEGQAACPDLGDRDAIGKIDWEDDFALSADEARTLTGALIADTMHKGTLLSWKPSPSAVDARSGGSHHSCGGDSPEKLEETD